jgi:hypothetical protein
MLFLDDRAHEVVGREAIVGLARGQRVQDEPGPTVRLRRMKVHGDGPARTMAEGTRSGNVGVSRERLRLAHDLLRNAPYAICLDFDAIENTSFRVFIVLLDSVRSSPPLRSGAAPDDYIKDDSGVA